MSSTAKPGERVLVVESEGAGDEGEDGTFAGALVAESAASRGAAPGGAEGLFVGDCTDDRHPRLVGRVLVRWSDGRGAARERWLPTLHGLAVRKTDRVLVQQPANWPEPIVTGVVDGHVVRPDVPRAAAATIALESDEALVVTTKDGAPLVEVRGSDHGPIVRLLRDDVRIEAPGKLELVARSIALHAENGPVTIDASDDVTVQGEVIRLN